MVSFFCPLLDDETIYSAIARYTDRVRLTRRVLTQELFGVTTITAVMDLPSHLSNFVDVLPQGHEYSTDILIENHTTLPYFAPFLPQERMEKIRRDMAGDSGGGIHTRIGIMAGRIAPPTHAQYCPLCIQHDISHHGESYWHREHQLPGIFVCPHHQVWLEQSFPIGANGQRHLFLSVRRHVIPKKPRPLDLNDKELYFHSVLAKGAWWLLKRKPAPVSTEQLSDRYMAELTKRGLSTHSGRIRHKRLLDAWNEYYPATFLESIQCQLDSKIEDNWLARLLRSPRTSQLPIQHLLFIEFLGYSVEEFFQQPDKKAAPFGVSPWPCLNKACVHHRQDVIRNCDIQVKEGILVGQFRCRCGFTYSRVGPDKSDEDRYRIGRIVAFGSQWYERLHQLNSDPKLSLREKARQLGVDPRTVQRQSDFIENQLNHESENSHNEPQDNRAAAYREQWEHALECFPNHGLSQLRGLYPAVYSWLYRNQREWLNLHKPNRTQRKATPSRVDWCQRDQAIAAQIPFAVEKIKLSKEFVQINLSSIGRCLGVLGILQQHLQKLPLCAELISALRENRLQFALRRVAQTEESYYQARTIPMRWVFERKAGIERLKWDPKVRSAVDSALEALASLSM